MLEGTSKLYKNPKARTLYLTIPASIARDSTFHMKAGDTVIIENHITFLVIYKKEAKPT